MYKILCTLLLIVSMTIAAEKTKLAVFKVESKLLGAEQSVLLSEMLTAECAKDPNYEVVPWQEVGNALKMASDKSKLGEISNKGDNLECTNSKCYDALGSLDVRYMVTARIEKPAQKLRMTLKLTDVELMKQVNIISTQSGDLDALLDSIGQSVKILLGTSSAADLAKQQEAEKQGHLLAEQKEKERLATEEAKRLAEMEAARKTALAQAKEDSIQQANLRLQLEKERLEAQQRAEVEAAQKAELQKQQEIAAEANAKKRKSNITSKLLGVALMAGGGYWAYVADQDMNKAKSKALLATQNNDATSYGDAKFKSEEAQKQMYIGQGLAGLGGIIFILSFTF